MHDEDVKTPVFLSHRETLRAVARKYLIHKEDVDDALQELFIRSWENRRADTTLQQKRAFLFASLRNICVDLLRRRKLRGVFIDDCPALPPPPATRHDPVESADTAATIRPMALARLSGLPLRVFELYTFDELDHAEIARRLDITPEAARSYLSRARKTMRAQCASLLKS